MSAEWKPGDVAMHPYYGRGLAQNISGALWWEFDSGTSYSDRGLDRDGRGKMRPLVVIDPEDREQVERLLSVYHAQYRMQWDEGNPAHVNNLQAALREFADPKPPKPTDPRACVTDRRDSIWRLLADGDWVCTSGPDIGEYLDWERLASDRGPLAIEVQP